MTPSVQHALVTIAILALIAWRMQARVRRMIGRHPAMHQMGAVGRFFNVGGTYTF